jgi:hypothetical protein
LDPLKRDISIRPARIEDAPVLAQAERTITVKPGLLASQPAELTDKGFARKILVLSRADNGCYLVAEAEGKSSAMAYSTRYHSPPLATSCI